VVNTGATSVFIMDGIKRSALHPLQISLPYGTQVTLTNICDITIPGLPITLMGHIVPKMTMASLLGIRVLCNMGCVVVFDDESFQVYYKVNLILMGYKDPKSNLWTLSIGQEELWTTPASSLEDPRTPKILLSHHGEFDNAPACAAKVQEKPSTYATCRGHRMSNSIQSQPTPCKDCAP
jgi:hypothetical protein